MATVDFASAPLQDLFIHNADIDQLGSYVQQLDRQFRETHDEKDRFGTLQILLPTLKAYLVRLQEPNEQEKCLEIYVPPLLASSFTQESMVSTESVHLLSEAVAYFIAYSLLDRPHRSKKEDENLEDTFPKPSPDTVHQPRFGPLSLSMFMGQLVAAVQTEPDFVDLHPMQFLISHIQSENAQLSCLSEWESVKMQAQNLCKKLETRSTNLSMIADEDADDSVSVVSTTTFNTAVSSNDPSFLGLFDLECCFDVLNLFVKCVSESTEFELDDPDSPAVASLNHYMDLLMAVVVAMVPCTDASIRSKLTNELIPNLFRWQRQQLQRQQAHQDEINGKLTVWCQMLWDRTLQLFALPATNLLRLETYGLIAKCFEFYFGLDPVSGQAVVHLDLRYNESFFKILQSGLMSNDAVARKYSSYILKRIIDFTNKYSADVDATQKSWTRFFHWSLDQSQNYVDMWDDWFLLYDIMHESVVHLVDPVMPRFEMLLRNTNVHLDPSWWILLLCRGFHNETGSVKKCILDYLFARRAPETLHMLGVQHDFIFGPFLKTLDVTALYSVPTQGTLVSPFAEHLKEFIVHLVNALKDKNEKIAFLQRIIHHSAHVVNSHVLILYILEALNNLEPVQAWRGEELKSLRYLVDRHRNFSTVKSKLYLRKIGMTALIKLADNTISFSDVAKTVSSLLTDYPITVHNQEYLCLRTWLKNHVARNNELQSVLDMLKQKTESYVGEPMSEDVPTVILRGQANVLVRLAILLIADDNGAPLKDSVNYLYRSLCTKLQDPTSSISTFNRQLVLLDALWSMCLEFFGPEYTDMSSLLGLDAEMMKHILHCLDGQLLNMEGDNVTDEETVDLFISMMQHILNDQSAFDEATRKTVIHDYFHKCQTSLQANNKSAIANKELSKPNHIRLLRVVYDAARNATYFELPCDQGIISFVTGVQMKRLPELHRTRSWGDTLSTLIRYKWECIHSIVIFATKAADAGKDASQIFDPFEVYNEAIDQLESASELCAEAIIHCLKPLLGCAWEKDVEQIEACVDHSIELVKENINQSKTFPPLIRAFMRTVFQPLLLSIPELNEDEGPMKKAFDFIMELGEVKPYIVSETVEILHSYWATMTPEACQSMLQYTSRIAKLLLFGPLRDREDQKVEASITLKLQTQAAVEAAAGTVESVFNQNDYLTRVLLNDLILRLDSSNETHTLIANQLLKEMLTVGQNEDLYEFMYTSTAEHRTKLRMCCSIMLLIHFVREDVDSIIEALFEMMRLETVTSVRCYMEWAMVRLFWAFPDRLNLLYNRLAKSTTKPSFMISILTVTIWLGEILDDAHVSDYFEEIFTQLLPWMITNHYTIRSYAYCSWYRNWESCKQRGLSNQVESNKYLSTVNNFMQHHTDCLKAFEKIRMQFYLTDFDPLKDYNVEFIFRQLMTVFGVIDNEKIASRAFIKVNPKPVSWCPFVNADRAFTYTAADAEELITFEEQPANDQNAEETFQKKILPWEMMLETDVDLTKSLVQKQRRRNDLIVVASLVDRIPNLAGLCRTCEIFNASQLVVYSLKVKEDPTFTNISVASEKWMPLAEVAEADVEAFLKAKKNENYVICGLEQTTNSVTLGEFEFPERCILLLGKERLGIPANLLQLLDQTIEIPQYGITRSLNVHVSGAICIYEYTKQMQWRQQLTLEASSPTQCTTPL
ncbi:uncharacterized protein BYT42DRAFT_563768 [Radiomyces spectabilis]|uniref:uncharacterized protein n=1 Tax=Radiomyces spectabilis TaxID=64574 RepID=UPI00221F51D2|nr:uncharacterized protein BYT42DRAFT_563768 [Radiomyces spectabilis]KAI8384828.1 hypothetical protein BYT42DRAFT_563768 [Radiomyces spectabilis]